jgi:SAM-dependent methyltransferase
MKINAGCGARVLPGYTNVDVQTAPNGKRPDILADLRKIPLKNACADELMAIHVFEHFYRWEVDDVLREWNRLLKSGGRLILEMPDVKKCCKALLDGIVGRHPDQLSYWGLWGDPRAKDPYMVHRWGWCADTLRPLLVEHGFTDIVESQTEWHAIGRDRRDFRIEARKQA